jgi:ADP-heptose:LPS heptosyltransferase
VSLRSNSPAKYTFRKRTNFAIAILSEMAAPLFRIAAKLCSGLGPSPPEEWRRGVLLGAGHIGDVLYCTASLQSLKEGLPRCIWHFVAPPPVSEVLANNPHIASCVPTLASLNSSTKIDVVICYNSGAYWRETIQAVRMGIPNRVGYTHKGFSGLVTHPITINYPQPYPAYFRDLVAQLTGRIPDWSLRPRIYPDTQDELAADVIWNEGKLDPTRPVVACFATSRQPSGVWPAKKFAETLAGVESNGEYRTVLCGTAADEKVLKELKLRFNLRAPIIAGRLNLRSLGCFLRRCAVVLCPDSGPRHIANAVGTPVVFVSNIAVGRVETGGYVGTETDVAPNSENVPVTKQEEMFKLLKPEFVAATVRSSFKNLKRGSGSDLIV